MKAFLTILGFFWLSWGTAHADSLLTKETANEVAKLVQAIRSVQPYLGETKLREYAFGIYRAASHFEIDPAVLIAIAQQETGFRENLPEGRAGEFGIVQIRKMWLKHAAFRKYFKNPTIADLKNPTKSFMMGAWILKDLKDRLSEGKTLPYWSYYNAVRFENRFKYYVAVNRNLAKLRKHQLSQIEKVRVAEQERASASIASPLSLPVAGKPNRIFWSPDGSPRQTLNFN